MSRNTDVASSVTTNPYSRICFRMGDADAKKLENGFSYFSAHALQNLGVGEAICRVEQAAYDFNLETAPLPQIDKGKAEMKRNRLIDLSRKMYGASRQEIEEMLAMEMRETFGKKILTKEKEPSYVPEKPVPNVAEKEIPKKPKENKVLEGSISDDIPLMGRGGPQHKYLQNLIKKIAEEKGYQSTIEYPIDSGAGQVDVALIRDDKKSQA